MFWFRRLGKFGLPRGGVARAGGEAPTSLSTYLCLSYLILHSAATPCCSFGTAWHQVHLTLDHLKEGWATTSWRRRKSGWNQWSATLDPNPVCFVAGSFRLTRLFTDSAPIVSGPQLRMECVEDLPTTMLGCRYCRYKVNLQMAVT